MTSRLFDVDPFTSPALELERSNGDIDDSTLGAVAERIVEARCLERGLDVSRPSADVRGVDLVVAGRRVQVKSTRRPRPEGSYRFKAGGRGARTFAELAERCDVFAFYAHDSGRLWLLSSDAVRERWRADRVTIRPNERAGLDAFELLERDDLTPAAAAG